MVQQLNPLQQLQIQQTGSLDNNLAQLSREEEQQKLREHESARDRVREGMLDPPERVSDEMIEDAKQRKDVEEGNYLRNPENMQKLMQVIQGGFNTYKALQQFPIEVIKGLLLKGLLGPKAMAGEQDIGKYDIETGDPVTGTNNPFQNELKIAPGDRGQYLDPRAKMMIMKAQEEYNLEQERKKNKKNRKK